VNLPDRIPTALAELASHPPEASTDPRMRERYGGFLIDTLDPLTIDSAPDLYWPKWTAPWWTMSLISELGMTPQIPTGILLRFAARVDRSVLHTFPIQESELPPDCDPYRHILCFCALGTLCRILAEASIDLREHLPWTADWFERYQLQDGGWNCDEAVYSKAHAHSSILSTVVMMEALTGLIRLRIGSTSDRDVLERAILYLLKHRIVRRSDGSLIDANWLRPSWPSFYFYDLLRGFSALADACDAIGMRIPRDLTIESLDHLNKFFKHRPWSIRRDTEKAGSLVFETGSWRWNQSAAAFRIPDFVKVSEVASDAVFRRIRRLLEILERQD